MKKVLILFISLLFLASCSQYKKLKDVGGSSNNENVVRIDSIDGDIYKMEASEQLHEILVGPIFNSLGQKVNTSDSFSVGSDDGQILVGSINATNIESFSSQKDINADSQGFLKFKVKLPLKSETYNLKIKSNTYESSTGIVYFQVEPTSIEDLGNVVSIAFEDSLPYNGIKEENENYGVFAEKETLITVGPITDKYSNLVNNREIDMALLNGYFPNVLTADGEGNIASYGRFEVIDGYVNIQVRNISNDEPMRIVGTLAGIVQSEDDIDRVESGELDVPYIDKFLAIVNSKIMITGPTDFGVVYIGGEKELQLTAQNQGNTPLSEVGINIEPPFVINGGTCTEITNLNPQQTCTISVLFRAQNRVFAIGNLSFNGSFGGEEIAPYTLEFFAQGAFPANITVKLEGNLVEFENQPVGDLVSKAFTVINTGDVSAKNLRFVNPPPHQGQIESFFTFRSPPPTVPNTDDSLGDHCGQEFQPQRKCKVYIDYLPKAKVGDQILAGTLVFDDIDPITIFTKGKSYVNNFERDITISSIKYQIRKDESDNVEVNVGPIRDIYGEVVIGQNIEVQVFRELEAENGDILKDYVGFVSSPNIVIGGPPNTYSIRTDDAGYANFNLKSRVRDSVGVFKVEAKIIDNDLNLLSYGMKEFEFIGTKLIFDKENYNLGETVIGKEYEQEVILTNEGSLDAQNIAITFNDEFFYIKEENSCLGIVLGTKNLNIGESCSFIIAFTATARTNFFDDMKIDTATFGTKNPATVFAKGINPATLSTEVTQYVDTQVINGDPLETSISFTNIGDETAINIQAYTLKENNSFQYSFNCTEVGPQRSCLLNLVYSPDSIPEQLLETQLVIVGVGKDVRFGTEVRIPITINHSSLTFTTKDPGININTCFELQVQGFDVEGSDLDFGNDIPLSLRNDGGSGNFYIDPNCASAPISIVNIPSNTFLSDKFYFKPTSPGNQILYAESSELASAIKSFEIYKDPSNLEIKFGNAQNTLVDKILPEKMITKVVDVDGKGIPNIPLKAIILEDISQKFQLIKNPTFNSSLIDWEIISGEISWFRGFGGSLKMEAIESIPQIKSSPIGLNIGDTYFLSATIAEQTGLPEAGRIIIQVQDTLSGAVYKEFSFTGKETRVFEYIAESESIRLNIKTAGFSPATRVYLDNIYFTEVLEEAPLNPIIYGTLTDNFPQYSDFIGPGNVSMGYQSGKVTLLGIVKVFSDHPSLDGKSALYSINTEIPTNITGILGSLVIDKDNGIALTKNGGDNLAQLESIDGYNWNPITKTLTLPSGRDYDFDNVNIGTETKLRFLPINGKYNPEWTGLYSKKNCSIEGTIENKGFVKSEPLEKEISFLGLDNENLNFISPEYISSSDGGRGGAGGYRQLDRDRSCNLVCGKSCTWSCDSRYGAWHWSTNFVVELGERGGQAGTPYKGGDGAKGQPGKYPGDYRTTTFPSETFGGVGGNKGGDGGLLFLHCYNNISGSGIIDLSGNKGENGNTGATGSYQDTNVWCVTQTGTDDNGQRNCTKQRYRRQLSGGAGGGSAGNGGHGGSLYIKTRSPNHSLTINISGGNGGSGGSAGNSAYGWNNGHPGSGGAGGAGGQCKEIDGVSQLVKECL